MESKITFGKTEAVSILIIGITTQLFLNFPRVMSESAGAAGWLLIIYVTVLTLILFTIIQKLYSRFEGKDILDIGETVGGGIGRVLIGVIYLVYYIFAVSITLREFGEDLKIIALTRSPISFVLLFFTVGMAIGAYYGIEPLGRLAAIVVPIVIVGFIIVLSGTVEYYDISHILPLMGTGPYNIFVNGATRISVFSGLSMLFLMAPFIGAHRNFKKVGLYGILISSFFLTIGTLIYLLSIPYPYSNEGFLPVYQLSRKIDYGRFFQRIESIFVIIWTMTALVYLSTVLFFITHLFKKTFSLKFYRPLVAPMTVIVFTLSLVPQSLMKAIELDTQVFRIFAWIVTFGITLLLLLIGTVVKRKKEGGVKREK
ncbi:MAG: endospore germination permease [Clostridiaceae bacterium]|nr:endospore germination permease [Clostridiaceae bacterium]